MNTSVLGEQVWEAYQQALRHDRARDLERKIMQPLVMAAPEVLADFLPQPLTMKTYLGARLAFMDYCIGMDIFEQIVEAAEELTGRHQEEFAERVERVFDRKQLELQAILNDIPGYLARRGMSEHDYMFDENIDLSTENLPKYFEGTLTVRELLLTQPGIILKG